MRALVLATTFPRSEADTIPAFVRDLSAEIASRGHAIHVLAPHAPGALLHEKWGPLEIHRFRYFISSYQRLAYGAGILNNVRRSHLAKLQVPLLSIQMMRHAARIAKRTNAEIIHSHWLLPSGIVGARVATKLRIPHVVTLHAGDVAGLSRLPGRAAIARYVIQRSSKVIAVSGSVANALKAIIADDTRPVLDERLEIMPMGVDTAAFQWSESPLPATPTFLFVGRLVEKKGILFAIEAFSHVHATDPSARLIVCGDGPLRRELEDRIEELHLSSAVDVRGPVPEAEKRLLLQRRPILLVPSITAMNGDIEGLPVTILEGLAAGCPVIASRTGGTPEAIQHDKNGILVNPRDARGLADAMIKLLRDPEHCRRLSTAAVVTAREFDWRAIGSHYDRIFQESSVAGHRQSASSMGK